jgi:26S proteasome regulatory subunit N6
LRDYKTELSDDPVIHSHLGTLYDNLLEQNLSRLLEPFSNVQIEHIARLINLPQVNIYLFFILKLLFPFRI